MKCKSKVIEYDYIQWNWNFVEVNKFCDGKLNWREKLEGKTILYGKNGPQDNQTIELGDYLVKDTNGNIKVYNENIFNQLFDIEDK